MRPAAKLRVFISHKMPTDTPLAEEIAAKLRLYSGVQMVVTHAGQFRYGERWREQIQAELEAADWLIFLFTDPDEDWEFCFFECGYFRRTMEKRESPEKQLITFCRHPNQVNAALQEFNAIVIDNESVTKLLRDIYHEEPWRLNPDLDIEVLRSTATDIVARFQRNQRTAAKFEVATAITLDIAIGSAERASLASGQLPPATLFGGGKGWHELLGRQIGSPDLSWTELQERWPFGDVYEYLLARIITDALQGRQPKDALLRAPDRKVYRISLQQFDRTSGERFTFHFSAIPVDLPFDLRHEAAEGQDSVVFQLLYLTWLFRRRIENQLYREVLGVLSSPQPREAVVRELYRADRV